MIIGQQLHGVRHGITRDDGLLTSRRRNLNAATGDVGLKPPISAGNPTINIRVYGSSAKSSSVAVSDSLGTEHGFDPSSNIISKLAPDISLRFASRQELWNARSKRIEAVSVFGKIKMDVIEKLKRRFQNSFPKILRWFHPDSRIIRYF